MENLSTIIGIVISIGGVFSVVVLGGLWILGIVKGKKDNEDDRLIGILQDTVTALEGKVNQQKREHDEILTDLTAKIKVLGEKVDELERENTTLIKVLQGRDAQTQEFYKQAFDAFKKVDLINTNHNELMKLLSEHLIKPGVTINNQTTP